MMITKTDLLPYVPFSSEAAIEDALRIQGNLHVLHSCAIRNEGIEDWCLWLEHRRENLLKSKEVCL